MIEPNQTRLDEFDNASEHRDIVHRRCLDAEIRVTHTRMIAINANGFMYQHEEKIDQTTEFFKSNQTCTVMLSEKLEMDNNKNRCD